MEDETVCDKHVGFERVMVRFPFLFLLVGRTVGLLVGSGDAPEVLLVGSRPPRIPTCRLTVGLLIGLKG
jgi:hypothetical protein